MSFTVQRCRDVNVESELTRAAFVFNRDGHLTMYSIIPGWYSGE